MNPLKQLLEQGQSFWFDQMRRSLVTTGELARMVREDGLRGMTSNPTIFDKAIGDAKEYDEQIEELVASGLSAPHVMTELMLTDIQMAADVLRPVFDSAGGHDGFISLEVPPALAGDTQATIEAARDLHARAARPNVMIKVPATEQGLPAIEQLLYEGLNINITLMFSMRHYEAVAQAFVRALQRRLAERKPIDHIASVASFFVSRVDTLVDRMLDERAQNAPTPTERERLLALRGRAAVANAKLAYERFLEIFHAFDGPFAALQSAGARRQRPLWASTGTKNPAYSDVLYIEELIGPETVSTMPDQTIAAFRDHGEVAETINLGLDQAHQLVAELSMVGIDLDQVGEQLQQEGVAAFEKSFDDLLDTIEKKVEAVARRRGVRSARLGAELEGAVTRRLRDWDKEGAAERLWRGDGTLWNAAPQEASRWLGWLPVVEEMRGRAGDLSAFTADVRRDGLTQSVVLGMGGSSLCPEVLARSFGGETASLEVIDTTHPDALRAALGRLDLSRTLVVVSSKSGTTLETRCQMDLLWERMGTAGIAERGRHFVAITDAGTELEKAASERGFRRVFVNRGDIGGRYSALSFFGLVPAALLGVDVAALLGRAASVAAQCGGGVPAARNPGLWLGAVLGEAAHAGCDKLTILASPGIAAFGLWAEQLVAESTGKLGRGIVPVAGEPRGPASEYGEDRMFVQVFLEGETQDSALCDNLEEAGHSVVRLPLRDRLDLGGQFLLWEIAVAMAGQILEINPFDQPNVQESKDNTRRVLSEWSAARANEEQKTGGEDGLTSLLDDLSPGCYFAVQAYLAPDPRVEQAVDELRSAVRRRFGVATTFGWGPRFLHSTGQLHKGGPDTGVFLQLTDSPAEDLAVPGQPYGFRTLIAAQAEGDLESLRAHQRRAARIQLAGDPAQAISRLAEAAAVPAAAGTR
jgi:transaldolase/glucose-6-phosphate isomerase